MGLPQIGTEMIRFPHRKFGQWLASIVLMPLLTTYYIHSYHRCVYYWYCILSLHTWAVDIFSQELVLVTGVQTLDTDPSIILAHVCAPVLHYLFVDMYDMRCRYLYLYLNTCMPSLMNLQSRTTKAHHFYCG
jgi:hypothetical protein